MSINIIPSIEILPIEILHRIFDNLDTETIIFSIRSVSRLFHSVVGTYNRYNLNFKQITKLNFIVLCRLINSENIISLTLSNDQQTSNQIDLFIKMIIPSKLTRLRSLTLFNINEYELYIILKHINSTNLILLSFSIKKDKKSSMETTINIITSFIEQSNLHKLELNLDSNHLLQISWPINCTIQYLTINTDIEIDELCRLLQYCPYVHTLIIKLVYGYTFKKIISKSFQQLKSLTIEKFNGEMNQLEQFLLLTPSLIYLKLIDGRQMLDGNRWKEFIEIYLPYLNKFEFFFKQYDAVERTDTDIELIVSSFRTSFWIEHKKWFIICKYSTDGSHICLYSIPICKFHLEYEPEYKQNSISTADMIVHDNNIKSLKLYLNKLLANHIQKKGTINSPLFPKVTEIYVEINDGWPSNSIQLFSILINFSQIIQLTWYANCCEKQKEQSLIDLNIFLQRSHNLSSLFIQNYPYQFIETIDYLCLIIPHYVKHLQIPIKSLKQIRTIFERCQNLSSVKFDLTNSEFTKEVNKWFYDNTYNSTCSTIQEEVNVWIGKINIQPIQSGFNNKCIIS